MKKTWIFQTIVFNSMNTQCGILFHTFFSIFYGLDTFVLFGCLGFLCYLVNQDKILINESNLDIDTYSLIYRTIWLNVSRIMGKFYELSR